jgi:hypothetical protein
MFYFITFLEYAIENCDYVLFLDICGYCNDLVMTDSRARHKNHNIFVKSNFGKGRQAPHACSKLDLEMLIIFIG